MGDLAIDYSRQLVNLARLPVQMTAAEYRLLFELSVNAGRVLTHHQPLRRVWGPNRLGNMVSLRRR